MSLINPSADIGVGLAVGLAAIFLTKDKAAGLWNRLASFFSRKSPTPDLVVPGSSENADVHDVVELLVSYFNRTKDRQGLQLATGVGIHVYEQALVDLTQPEPPTPIK